MRFGKFVLIGGLITAFTFVSLSSADAQLRRRSTLGRPHAVQRGAVPSEKAPTTAQKQKRDMITGKVVQLSPLLAPAAGPSGALGVGSIFYNDVDTSLNSGNLVVTGLPAGEYDAWLVFFDPFASGKIYSELVAEFSVTANGARTETALAIGLPNIINMIHAKQLVVTHHCKTMAQVGQAPVPGAAGYPGGPAKGQAILAANIN